MRSKRDIEDWLRDNLPPDPGESWAEYLIRCMKEFDNRWHKNFRDYAWNVWSSRDLEEAIPPEPTEQPGETMQWAIEYSTLTNQSAYSRAIAQKLGIARSTLYNWLKKVIEI